jgi:hypothetical protein
MDLYPINAPRNYKDPTKIEEYIANKQAELANGAAAKEPLTGSISRVVGLVKGKRLDQSILGELDSERLKEDGLPQQVFSLYGADAGSRMLDQIMQLAGMVVNPKAKDSLCLIGHKIHLASRLAAIDWISRGGPSGDAALPFSLQWALGFDPEFKYGHIPGFIDPIQLVFGSSTVDINAAASRLSVDYTDDADQSARMSFELSKKIGL